MSDSASEAKQPEGDQGWLLVLYGASKRRMPKFMLSALSNITEAIRPAATRLRSASEPLRKALVSSSFGEFWRTLDFSGKVRLYATTLRGWLAHHTDFPGFIAYMQAGYAAEWGEGLRTSAVAMYTRLKTACRVDDVLYLSAFLLSEGNQRLQTAMVSAWELAKSPGNLHKTVEALLSAGPLSQAIKDNVRIFSSLASMKEEITNTAKRARLRVRRMVKSARVIASRTVFVLYHTADVAIDTSLRVVDERLVSKVTSPPRALSLRGNDRLLDMEARLRSELTQFLAAKKQVILTSALYTSVETRVSASLVFLRDVSVSTKDAIASSEWPEAVKSPIDSVLVFVGMGSVLKHFDKAVWSRLDQDKDGVVTLRDLFQTFSPAAVLRTILKVYAAALSRKSHSD